MERMNNWNYTLKYQEQGGIYYSRLQFFYTQLNFEIDLSITNVPLGGET